MHPKCIHRKTSHVKDHLPCNDIHGNTFRKKYPIPWDNIRGENRRLAFSCATPISPAEPEASENTHLGATAS